LADSAFVTQRCKKLDRIHFYAYDTPTFNAISPNRRVGLQFNNYT